MTLYYIIEYYKLYGNIHVGSGVLKNLYFTEID